FAFCSSACNHSSLRSFPTRRSSDLLFPRQRRAVDFGTRSRSGDSVEGELFELARPKEDPPSERRAAGVGSTESTRTRIGMGAHGDRKSTRLNSSHQIISYAVFCLKQ